MPMKMMNPLMSPDGSEPNTTSTGRTAMKPARIARARTNPPALGRRTEAFSRSAAGTAGASAVADFAAMRKDARIPWIATGVYVSATEP